MQVMLHLRISEQANYIISVSQRLMLTRARRKINNYLFGNDNAVAIVFLFLLHGVVLSLYCEMIAILLFYKLENISKEKR